MPVLHGTLTAADGALQTILLELTRMDVARRRRTGSPVPLSVTVAALIDTGSEITCIDPSIVSRLGLTPKNLGPTNVPAAGGFQFNWLYDVNLTIPHPFAPAAQQLVIPVLEVAEVPLNARGCDALIGRDVLASCVLIYDGVGNSFTLTY